MPTETAILSMRELLEKAHQEDDELFAEAENDDDFEAPRELLTQRRPIVSTKFRWILTADSVAEDVRDVFLEDFADTEDEFELEDDEDEERAIRREERRKVRAHHLGSSFATASIR